MRCMMSCALFVLLSGLGGGCGGSEADEIGQGTAPAVISSSTSGSSSVSGSATVSGTGSVVTAACASSRLVGTQRQRVECSRDGLSSFTCRCLLDSVLLATCATTNRFPCRKDGCCAELF